MGHEYVEMKNPPAAIGDLGLHTPCYWGKLHLILALVCEHAVWMSCSVTTAPCMAPFLTKEAWLGCHIPAEHLCHAERGMVDEVICVQTSSVLLAEVYRQAVDLNPRDYRAWYGLGQTYELLHMPVYALHYYQRATQVPAHGRISESTLYSIATLFLQGPVSVMSTLDGDAEPDMQQSGC